MKYIGATLHVILTLSMFVVMPIGISNYASSEIESNNAETMTLTIKADKPVYERGETIHITGKVSEMTENLQIFLTIVNPANTNIYELKYKTTPHSDGTYEYKIKVDDVLASVPTCVNVIYTIEATYAVNGTFSNQRTQTTFKIETREQLGYAQKAGLHNVGEFFWKEYQPEYPVLDYIFLKGKPPCSFVTIFKMLDKEGYVYRIKHIDINNTNSHLTVYSDSAYDPPLVGIELGTIYLQGIRIGHAGNYTLEVYTWTNLENPTPVADVIRLRLTVLELYSHVRKGDIMLAIETPQLDYSASQNVTVILTATNMGNSDLTFKNNHQLPLNISLYVYSNGDYLKPDTKIISCMLYPERLQEDMSINGTLLKLGVHDSWIFKCEYVLNNANYSEPVLHLRAIGKLTGLLEPWDEEKYGEKPTQSSIVLLSTNYIDFNKRLIEFNCPNFVC